MEGKTNHCIHMETIWNNLASASPGQWVTRALPLRDARHPRLRDAGDNFVYGVLKGGGAV
ncbi:hypothetical protein G7K71_03150 [Desulfofundulus sp. TPOSR]|uniref:hypothetical protein n=1 Tax=Desulfofundulus sp. TPOSR TaxID=2714340 RepID=UPI00140E89F8|nr:hypothetical protein [Desulfofundulus sp. TPOSR]NHM26023.1 hypothetical protein [Desulfofundulus sp. TPOSR]